MQIEKGIKLISQLCPGHNLDFLAGSNTAREIYERLIQQDCFEAVEKVCEAARHYHQSITQKDVTVYLVHHDRTIKYITR